MTVDSSGKLKGADPLLDIVASLTAVPVWPYVLEANPSLMRKRLPGQFTALTKSYLCTATREPARFGCILRLPIR